MKISRKSRSFAAPSAATNERSANEFGDFHSFVQRNTGEHLTNRNVLGHHESTT
jgi:hypothetical protein